MTVCLSFLQTEMDEEQQIDMVDTNQPPRTTMAFRRDAAGNNFTWFAPAWNSFLNAVNWVLKWLYIGIEWPKDINSDAFSRMKVTASDSTCPADGVSLTLMSTLLYRIAFAPARKPYWTGLLFTLICTNGDFGAVSVKAILHETIRNNDF